MVYNWDGKETDCYRLYVEEKKSLDEVISFWHERGFTPSKRAFQTQFKRWEFPSKQNPAHKNEPLVVRVKELWAANMMQKDMVEKLQDEGFQINDRELMRVRLRFNLLLRERTSKGERRAQQDGNAADKARKMRKPTGPSMGLIDQLANAILQEESSSNGEEEEEDGEHQDVQDSLDDTAVADTLSRIDNEPPPLNPEEALRRQMRLHQLQAESAEKWRTRKRRRRTRGWASLPADAPGAPPRFPSETTLDEGKAYLGLDNTTYRQIREEFQAICEEEHVTKKTIAGPEKWGRIKDRLVRDNAHLSTVFQNDPEARQQNISVTTPSNHKALSLDLICMDVTKRKRTQDSRMSIPEAKNALGLNPRQTREVRNAFHAKLKADHFTNKFEAGEQHWNDLKQAWVQESDHLTRNFASGQADPRYAEKLKAVEVLARDVMKRLRHETVQKDPSKKKQVTQGPGPGPAHAAGAPHASKAQQRHQRRTASNDEVQTNARLASVPSSSELQIDPSLLLAASDPSMIPEPHSSFQQAHDHHDHHEYVSSPRPFNDAPLPIYFRLHPHSITTMPNKTVWLGILQGSTVAELKALAVREHPGTLVVKVEGLVVHKAQGQPNREVMIAIDDEDELAAYLAHVAGGKPTFLVLLTLAQGVGLV